MNRFFLLSILLGLPLVFLAQELPVFELDHRIQLSVDRLTDLNRQPAFTHDFLLADVDLEPADPRRFYNFSGDLSGRYTEVMSLLSPAQRRAIGLDSLVAALLTHQRADGRFGDPDLRYTAGEIGGEHMALLWGNGRLLVGLMTYYEQTGNRDVLAAARRLGDFFITTAAACREPEVVALLEGFGAKGIICFTQYIEGLVMLARATELPRFVEAAQDAYTILPPRGTQHTHGYLSTLRGVLMLYELTGNEEALAYARQTFDDLLASEDHTVYGAVFEYFNGDRETNRPRRDEGCATADFVRLSFHLYDLTGDERYLEVAEKALLNALYYNQCGNGDFGHHYIEHGVMKASNPRRAWWCCTMHGLRALLAVRNRHLVQPTADGVAVRVLASQTYADDRHAFSLRQEGVRDGRERYTIEVSKWPESSVLVLPQPSWGTDWRLELPEGSHAETTAEDRLAVSGLRAGSQVALTAEVAVRFHRSEHRSAQEAFPDVPTHGYLSYGPYLLGVNQESFVAEPDWANQVLLTELAPAAAPNTFTAAFRHSGYPGLNPVRLVPMAHQLYQGHPYLRVYTRYGNTIVPQSPDE